MDRRFEARKQEMLAECEVSPEHFEGTLDRMNAFVQPFAECLGFPAQRVHTTEYVSGLISDLGRKSIESITYRHDQDRKNLQHLIGSAEWEHQPPFMKLARKVGEEIGEEDGVTAFDPSAFPNLGKQSVGVARLWCGRLGNLENCQVGQHCYSRFGSGSATVWWTGFGSEDCGRAGS